MASLSMLIFSSNKVTSLVTEHHYLPDRDLTKLYQIQHPKPPVTFSSIPCLTLETAWPELLMNNKYPFGDPHRNDGISSELISLPRRRCNISSHLGRHSTDPAARCPLRADPTAASVLSDRRYNRRHRGRHQERSTQLRSTLPRSTV